MAQEGQKAYTEQYVRDIADAIRGMNGSQDQYRISDMADAIGDIHAAEAVIDRQISNVSLNTQWLPPRIFDKNTTGAWEPSGATDIMRLNIPNVTYVGELACRNQAYLRTVDLGTTRRTISVKGDDAAFGYSSGTQRLTKFGYSDENYIGVTTSAISNNSTANPITINDSSVTAKTNDVVYDSINYNPYKWDGSKWVYYPPDPASILSTDADIFRGQSGLVYLNFWIAYTDIYTAGAMYHIPAIHLYITGAGTTAEAKYAATPGTTAKRVDFSSKVNQITSTDVFKNSKSSLKIMSFARDSIVPIAAKYAPLSGYEFLGKCEETLSNGSTLRTITVNGTSITLTTGQKCTVRDANDEYYATGQSSYTAKWQKLTGSDTPRGYTDNSLFYTDPTARIYVPQALVNDYKAYYGWDYVYEQAQLVNNELFYPIESMPT